MLERRRDFLRARGQCDPALQAEHLLAVATLHVGRPFGMGDAAAGGHQVHRAGLDLLDVALAVAVHDAAVEQIADGGKPDMRMRAHVHALAGHELHRAEMIEEDERPDHLPLAVRQRAPDLKPVAEIAGARHDDEFERVAGFGIAEHGIVGRLPAHGGSFDLAKLYPPLHVIASASEAIQKAGKESLDCFVACAPRNDGGKHVGTKQSIK